MNDFLSTNRADFMEWKSEGTIRPAPPVCLPRAWTTGKASGGGKAEASGRAPTAMCLLLLPPASEKKRACVEVKRHRGGGGGGVGHLVGCDALIRVHEDEALVGGSPLSLSLLPFTATARPPRSLPHFRRGERPTNEPKV